MLPIQEKIDNRRHKRHSAQDMRLPIFSGKCLAQFTLLDIFKGNTRAVPLVRKEDAHQGRVFFCPITKEGGAG